MYHYFVYLLLFCEGMASLVSLIYWKRNENNEMKYFSLYLTFIFLSEVFGHITQKLLLNNINQMYFEYFVIPLEFLFFFWLYSTQAKSKFQKKIIYSFAIIYILLFLLDFILAKNLQLFLSISYMVGIFLSFLVTFNYLYQNIKEGDLNNPYIYISIGLIIFYIGTFPFYGIKNYLWTHYRIIGHNYWYVTIILNCIMYCLFTISFLCKNKHKSISP